MFVNVKPIFAKTAFSVIYSVFPQLNINLNIYL